MNKPGGESWERVDSDLEFFVQSFTDFDVLDVSDVPDVPDFLDVLDVTDGPSSK